VQCMGVAARAQRKRRNRRSGLCCTKKERKSIMVEDLKTSHISWKLQTARQRAETGRSSRTTTRHVVHYHLNVLAAFSWGVGGPEVGLDPLHLWRAG
jgi:hypothetical protein